MNYKKKKIKALGLCSGGLDSILSALVLREQEIDVTWISFETPFFSSQKAKKASVNHNIRLITKDITSLYLTMLKNPPNGYGKNMNPCTDCHSLMFKIAGEVMHKKKFDFLFSGEVAGQRPMSQTKQALRYVEKKSGFDGYILRPLSAKILPETLPEQKGFIKRELLLDISGRSRKRQIEIAEKFGVKDYPAPAGGCLLTDKIFSIRLKDLFDNQENFLNDDLYLLRHGRHFRLGKNQKIIVGRTKTDNQNIMKYYRPQKDNLIHLENVPSPTVLFPRNASSENIEIAASICAGYTRSKDEKIINVIVKTPEGVKKIQISGPKQKYTSLML